MGTDPDTHAHVPAVPWLTPSQAKSPCALRNLGGGGLPTAPLPCPLQDSGVPGSGGMLGAVGVGRTPLGCTPPGCSFSRQEANLKSPPSWGDRPYSRPPDRQWDRCSSLQSPVSGAPGPPSPLALGAVPNALMAKGGESRKSMPLPPPPMEAEVLEVGDKAAGWLPTPPFPALF